MNELPNWKQKQNKEKERRMAIMRTIYNYAEIANIRIEIDTESIRNGECRQIAKIFAQFFDDCTRQAIEDISCLDQLIPLLGSKESFKTRVKLYRFSKIKEQRVYAGSSHSVKTIGKGHLYHH